MKRNVPTQQQVRSCLLLLLCCRNTRTVSYHQRTLTGEKKCHIKHTHTHSFDTDTPSSFFFSSCCLLLSVRTVCQAVMSLQYAFHICCHVRSLSCSHGGKPEHRMNRSKERKGDLFVCRRRTIYRSALCGDFLVVVPPGRRLFRRRG